MLMKIYQLMFLMFLFSGTTVAISSESWFLCWLGLEINLMSMIPLILIKMSPVSTEAAIKYFLAQAIASTILVFSSLFIESMFNTQSIFNNNSPIFLALVIKAGLAPFHFWFPQVMNLLNWNQCILMLTWQKIAPFILMSSMEISAFQIFIIMASSVGGGLGGLNQMKMKIILTYSSIAHSGWMVALILFSKPSFITYFVIYSLISINFIFLIKKNNMLKIPQLNESKWNLMEKTSFIVVLLSLGGLPPFLGFLAKLSALDILILKINPLLISMLIISSLTSLFYYMRVVYSLIMGPSQSNKNSTIKNLNKSILSQISISGNLILPMLVFLI